MIVAGVDEAGRGPLAGPVTVAAVILNKPIDGLADSKKLSEKKREILANIIKREASAWSIVHIDVTTIDEVNILQASLLGMQQAVEALNTMVDVAKVDGNKAPKLAIPVEAIIGGDGIVAEISAASILAKTARDALMRQMDARYPGYGFAKHKGYPTQFHMAQLRQLGPCIEHRKTFAPVARLLQQDMWS